MNFNSLPFLVLTAITFIIYYLPVRSRYWQVAVLVTASLIFYGWATPYLVLLLLFCATTTSWASAAIAHTKRVGRQRLIAAAASAAMLVVLVFFKYNRLIGENLFGPLSGDAGSAHWLLMLPLPIGISFFTFHGISLVVDTFAGRGGLRQIPSKRMHVVRTLHYLTFFPQLIAGPIMKARDFFPQIEAKSIQNINWEAVARALIVGYFLKLVVADNLSVLTKVMTMDVTVVPGTILIALIFAYSCQIFADFAGYSLIAIGLGRLFGYELMANFNFPYLSQSFSEFWHRWHISLSTWLRDYLYVPLGGNRCGWVRQSFNIMVVMALGGLWHGAAWSYAVWGTVHGFALVVERPFLQTRFYRSDAQVLRLLRTAIVVGIVSLAWLLFRLPDFSHVYSYALAVARNRDIPSGGEVLMAAGVYSLPVVLYHLIQLGSMRSKLLSRQTVKIWVFAALVAITALNSGVPGAFIYFQF